MKVRSTRGCWGDIEKKLKLLPIVLLLCFGIIFFLAGYFFGSMMLLSQDIITGSIRPQSTHGDTGDSFVSEIPFQVLSWKPRVLYFPGFATAEQCQNIITGAKNKTLKTSTTLASNVDLSELGVRTSTGTFVPASEDKTGTLDLIEQKIARVTMIPRTHGEAFNVLRYEIGQRYVSHYDPLPDFGFLKSQRMISFLLYLSDVEQGGESNFPLENGLNMEIQELEDDNDDDNANCIGLKVKPRQGDGLMFYSLHPNGTMDRLSLHGSCPVKVGEKWVATKWIRSQDETLTIF